jgi:hypothetical protein
MDYESGRRVLRSGVFLWNSYRYVSLTPPFQTEPDPCSLRSSGLICTLGAGEAAAYPLFPDADQCMNQSDSILNGNWYCLHGMPDTVESTNALKTKTPLVSLTTLHRDQASGEAIRNCTNGSARFVAGLRRKKSLDFSRADRADPTKFRCGGMLFLRPFDADGHFERGIIPS